MNATFLRRLLLLTGLQAVALVMFQKLQQQYILNNLIWAALIYFALLTVIINRIALSGLHKDSRTFIKRVNGAIGIRLLFSLFPLILYFLFWPETSAVWVLTYLMMYFIFTTFEMYTLVANLRPDSNKK